MTWQKRLHENAIVAILTTICATKVNLEFSEFEYRKFWTIGRVEFSIRILHLISDMNTVESRFLEPLVSLISRYLAPNLVSIAFASLKLYFSNPWFLETSDNSNHFQLPWGRLTPRHLEPANISKLLSVDVNYIHTFKVALYTIFQRFEYHMCVNLSILALF